MKKILFLLTFFISITAFAHDKDKDKSDKYKCGKQDKDTKITGFLYNPFDGTLKCKFKEKKVTDLRLCGNCPTIENFDFERKEVPETGECEYICHYIPLIYD